MGQVNLQLVLVMFAHARHSVKTSCKFLQQKLFYVWCHGRKEIVFTGTELISRSNPVTSIGMSDLLVSTELDWSGLPVSCVINSPSRCSLLKNVTIASLKPVDNHTVHTHASSAGYCADRISNHWQAAVLHDISLWFPQWRCCYRSGACLQWLRPLTWPPSLTPPNKVWPGSHVYLILLCFSSSSSSFIALHFNSSRTFLSSTSASPSWVSLKSLHFSNFL